MKTVLKLLTASLMLTGNLFAQSPPCGVDSLQEYYSQNNPHYHSEQNAFIERINEYRQNSPTQPYFGPGEPSTSLSFGCRTTRYIIPVVVHIDEVDSTIQVSDTQVYQQIQILNDAFAPYQIQFCLAKKRPNGLNFNGINRMSPFFNPASFELNDQLPELTDKDYYNPSKYLNIYIVKDIHEGGYSSGLLGYNGSNWGSTNDAIVIRHNYFGDSTSCANCGALASGSRGKILVHEVGHYLGLRHTFQGSCTGGNNASTCSYDGDLCCDTRPVLAPGSTCSIDTSYRSCLTYHLSLPENRTNYMDYSGETCMDNFTPDQVSIMHATLEIFRSGLIHTENVNYLAANCCAGSAWFDSDNDVVCLGDSVWLSAYEYNSTVNYYWAFYRSGETQPFLDTVLTNPRWFYIASDTNTFTVSLKITSVLGDTVGITRLNFLTIKNCGSLLSSTQGSWYFGDHAGIRFTTAGVLKDIMPKLDDPNNIKSSEGTISVCDSAGNLLFYGGPRLPKIWDPATWKFEFPLFNRDYLPMQGGRIVGDPSASQGGIVIPIPGSDHQFYVISTCGSTDATVVFPDSAGLRYSVVDMALNSGLGDIDPTAVNIPVRAPSGSRFNSIDSAFFSGEFLTAIPKCGSEDYWLITNDASGSGYANFNKLVVYSVSSSGITHHATTSIVLEDNGGQLKASPDGSLLASPSTVMKFDRILGVITPYRNIPLEYTWGVSFSPDSRKLYVFSHASNISTLWQFDMESSDSLLSGVIITANFPRSSNQMQLGPDNKLYLTRVFDPRVGVINAPDSLCNPVQNNKCEFQVDGPYTQTNGHGGTNYVGFPNMIDAKADVEPDFTMVDSGCGTVKFRPNNSCAFSYQWNFGDGSSTSSLAEPTHIYSTKDSFEITLTINGSIQVKRKIAIGIPRPEIVGDTNVCDTSVNAFYSVNSPNSFFRYTWYSDDADLFPDVSNPHGTRAVWHHNGSLIVKAEYDKNGCYDYDTFSIVINIISGNEIEDDQNMCNGSLPSLLTGDTANVLVGDLFYRWQKNVGGGGWQNINSSDTINWQPDTLQDKIIMYRRIAGSGTCLNYSNEVTLTPHILDNTISLDVVPELTNCNYQIEGSTPNIWSSASPVYQWFYLEPDSAWKVAPFGQNKDIIQVLIADSVRLFRRITAVGCTSYSDTITVKPSITITRHPKNFATCDNRVYFTVGYDNPLNIPLQFTWMYSDTIGGAIDRILVQGYQNTDSLNYYESGGIGNYYVCQISTLNCDARSGWARYVRDPDTSVFFLQHPVALDTLVNEWDSAVIVVRDSSINGDPNTFKKAYTWQKSYDNVNFFAMFTDSASLAQHNNDTLVDYDLYASYEKIYYRVSIQSAEYCDYAISNSTVVHLYGTSDIWSMDSPADTGGEPNGLSANNYWNSPDIWNNVDPQIYSASHQNPEYKNFSPNRIHVRVRNKGQSYTKPSKVYLYWTLPSTREDWDEDWRYDLVYNGFYNADSGLSYPLGSEINDTGIIIGPLAPNADTIVSYDWWPPNPAWYYTDTSGTRVSFPERMLCLLSRIEESDIAPYGMASAEVIETTINVKNNNNIVTKNTTLFNKNQGDMILPIRYHYPIVVGRHYEFTDELRLGLVSEYSLDFFNYADVTVVLDDSLYAAWALGGFQGTGFTANAHRLLITDPSTFSITDIVVNSNHDFQAVIELEFFALPETAPLPFKFRFMQYSDNNLDPDGGVYLEGQVPFRPVIVEDYVAQKPTEIIEDEEAGTEVAVEKSVVSFDTDSITVDNPAIENSQEILRTGVIAFPNPFTNEVNIQFVLPEESKVQLELFNAMGAKVAVVSERSYPKGTHRVVLNGTYLAPGMYLCRVKIGTETKTLNLIIAR